MHGSFDVKPTVNSLCNLKTNFYSSLKSISRGKRLFGLSEIKLDMRHFGISINVVSGTGRFEDIAKILNDSLVLLHPKSDLRPGLEYGQSRAVPVVKTTTRLAAPDPGHPTDGSSR